MSTINDIREAIADIVLTVPEIDTAYGYRPAAFNTTPLLYVDVPSYDRTAMGKGSGRKVVTLTMNAVLIVSTTWAQAQQKTLDDLMVPVHDAIESVSRDGESYFVSNVRGLTARQNLADDGDGLPVGPIGAAYTVQIQAKL